MRLIALDIDGTLLDSRWKLPEANRAAIAEATRRGIEVALVTGRRYDFAMPIAREVDTPLTMIVSNGALVRTLDGETRVRHLLPLDTAGRILEVTKPWREGAGVVFDRPRENQVMLEFLETDDPIRQAYYARNKEFLGCARPLESCLTEDPLQVMLSGKVQPMRDAEATLRAAPFAAEYWSCGHPLRKPRFCNDRCNSSRTARRARRWRNGRLCAALLGKKSWPSVTITTISKCCRSQGFRW